MQNLTALQPTSSVSSAGILCYMVHENTTYVILGREQYVRNWRGSHKWSDFGGRKNESDVDEIDTASRESFEETMGLFGDTRAALEGRQYNFKFTFKRSGRRFRNTRVMYAMQIPWQPELPKRFYGMREHLKHILFAVAVIRKVQCHLSRNNLPVPDYPYRVNGRFMLVLGLDRVQQLADGTTRVKITCIRAAQSDSSYFTMPPKREHRARNISMCSVDSTTDNEEPDFDPRPTYNVGGAICEEAYVDVPTSHYDTYAKVIKMHERLMQLIAAYPADVVAGAVVWRDYADSLRSWLPYVRREFLEKDVLRLWTIPELHQAIIEQRQNRMGSMRLSFLPPLKIFLQKLAQAPDGNWRSRVGDWSPTSEYHLDSSSTGSLNHHVQPAPANHVVHVQPQDRIARGVPWLEYHVARVPPQEPGLLPQPEPGAQDGRGPQDGDGAAVVVRHQLGQVGGERGVGLADQGHPDAGPDRSDDRAPVDACADQDTGRRGDLAGIELQDAP